MARTQRARIRTAGLQPAQVLAGLASLAFLVFGIVGFTRTGFADFAGRSDTTVLGFSVNPLYNLGFVLMGLIGLLLTFSSGRARVFGFLTFVAFGALFVWGLMITGTVSTNPVSEAGNPFNLNGPDNWLHLGLAALGLVIAFLPARHKVLLPEDEEENVVVDRADSATAVDPVRDGSRSPKHEKSPTVAREERPPGLAH
ncbi:DUF4383 domain-containing protein [Amycolatopsis regifaucium]|uniref:DUF4383 domain-containing protein n=1 Tax=Amycolatopsis regifaucium TaxID=546365 RepID=A0A154MBU9_9PSEU|nr:DUF4383 domain-containing protein [Amycolatopsis regifaucium]KZB81763.1 hypothetical protein AVL48_07230 [Amycolatopsis regifaucium]OKA06171.1 hypothetical protein ATP06_0223775 [Amycolatopsis regifaucium]SFG70630.1 protein of unknown function [Amycolatopsis regifaucium]